MTNTGTTYVAHIPRPDWPGILNLNLEQSLELL